MHKQRDKEPSKNIRGKVSSIIGVIIGLVILGVIAYRSGFSNITEAFAKGGPELLLLAFFYPIELLSRGFGWKYVYPVTRKKPGAALFMIGMWFAQSINRLLPTATIGGMIARGRFLVKRGSAKTEVITSLIADKTAHAVATVIILILGVALILTKGVSTKLLIILIAASVMLAMLTFIFIHLQRSSGVSKFLDKWANDNGGFLSAANNNAEIIEKQLERIYAHPSRFILSIFIRVTGDIALAAEVWVAARMMGTPITVVDALALRLVGFGVRSVAFVIWGGIGIQESTYALLSAFVGLSPASLIAISLATRVREIITAIPGVILWLTDEGVRMFKSSRSGSQVKQNIGNT